MFEQTVNPGSLTKLTAAEKRGFRARWCLGALLFGIGVLLQTAREYGPLLLGLHTKSVAIVLWLLGIALILWAAVVAYHNSGSSEEKSRAVTTRH